MPSWLVYSVSDRAVWVQARPRDTVLCPCAIHFIITVLLYTQGYKWVPTNCSGRNLTNCRGALACCPGEVKILLATSWIRNWDKLWQSAPRLHFFYTTGPSLIFQVDGELKKVAGGQKKSGATAVGCY